MSRIKTGKNNTGSFMKFARTLLWTCTFIISLFYGVIISGQALGLMKIYNVILAAVMNGLVNTGLLAAGLPGFGRPRL
jgi:hypothetical protein